MQYTKTIIVFLKNACTCTYTLGLKVYYVYILLGYKNINWHKYFKIVYLKAFYASFFFTDVPIVQISVDSQVCCGSESTIKSLVSSIPTPKKIEWQNSKDGIDFFRISKPEFFETDDSFTCPFFLIPETTFADKRYYRLLVWNGIGESVSNTVYLNITGSMVKINFFFYQIMKLSLYLRLSIYSGAPKLKQLPSMWLPSNKHVSSFQTVKIKNFKKQKLLIFSI